MADVLKVLGQVDPAATTVTTALYTVPDMTQTTVSSIVAANRTGSAITFRLSVHVAGAGADDKQYIILRQISTSKRFPVYSYWDYIKSNRCRKSLYKCSRHEF